MKIKSFQGGYDKNLSYLIWCESNYNAAIVDASVNFSEIYKYIIKNNLKLKKIFITHTHADHIHYLSDILNQFPELEICGFENPEAKIEYRYRKLKHLDIINIGMQMITILHTPGHYPDSICFWNKKDSVLFTGDTMFVGRVGRTVSKGSNVSDLYDSIYNKILKLPKETIIYPGHNYGHVKKITLKENIILHPFFQCVSESGFINVMEAYEKGRNTNM